ncbi:MAG TPA: hypothetical protein VGT60_03335 [Candidatus Limnocylindria bacterium]|nr:hypothetical protein [Candidatus Limnocylindria bacterium]
MTLPGAAAFGIAVLSILYAIVFLGFVRGHPDAHVAAAIANACIASSGLLVTVAASAIASRIGTGSPGSWIGLFGVGYGLLSATHGAFAAISELAGTTAPGISPTDPRGFATFGLAGLWMLTLGIVAPGAVSGWPGWLTPVSIAGGLDLVALFVATVAGAELPILLTGGLASVILGPAFWIGIGTILSLTSRTT